MARAPAARGAADEALVPPAAASQSDLVRLACERRALHAEGLLAAGATAALAAAGDLPGLAVAPLALLYAAMTLGWVARFLAMLGRECPRCGGLFFYSLERLLYSLPYLRARCAHCDEPLGPARKEADRVGRRAVNRRRAKFIS